MIADQIEIDDHDHPRNNGFIRASIVSYVRSIRPT
jgi:hypothetical protein